VSGPPTPRRAQTPDAAEAAAWSDPALAARPPLLDTPPAAEARTADPLTVAFTPSALEPEEAGMTALQRLVAEQDGPVTVDVAGRDGVEAPEPPSGEPGAVGRRRADRVAEDLAAVAPPGSRVVARAERVPRGARGSDSRRAQVRVRPGAPPEGTAPGAGTDPSGRPAGALPTPRDRSSDPRPPAPTTGTGRAGVHAGEPGRAPAVRDGESRRGTPQPRFRRAGEGTGTGKGKGQGKRKDVNGLDIDDEGPSGPDTAGWRPAILRPASSDPTGRAASYDLDLASLTPAYGLRGAAPVPDEHAERLRGLAGEWDERLRDAGIPGHEARRLVHQGLAQAVDRALVFTGLEPPERFVLDERALPHPPPPGHRAGARVLLARLLGPPTSPEGGTP
jgi:hypothetical protein